MDFGIPRPTTPNTVMYDGAEDSTDNLHNALAKKYANRENWESIYLWRALLMTSFYINLLFS